MRADKAIGVTLSLLIAGCGTVQQNPTTPELLRRSAAVFRAQNQPDEAKRLLQQAIAEQSEKNDDDLTS